MPTRMVLLIVAAAVSISAAQSVVDPNLRVQTYLSGLSDPSGMVFLDDSGDALITQKTDGRVLFMHDKKIVGTALDLPVANDSERGLLSVALSPGFATNKQVYLYYTAAAADGGTPISNKIARFTWDGSKLTFNRKIIDLPTTTGPNHDGGKIAFDSKGKLYAVIGDLNQHEQTQNFENSILLSQRGVILRMQPDGKPIPTNPFASVPGAQNIYAYGIRNSFGLTFDPVTGNLWDTENGPENFDEINRVTPGFNSGWRDIMGPVSRNGGKTGTLVSLGSAAHYEDPQFSWDDTIAPTDLHFFNSTRLGSKYENDLFVGDVKTGSIFDFNLSSTRKSLDLTGPLVDKVADNTGGDLLAEQSSIIFGSDFGTVTQLLNGPGGLFALSLSNDKLYRITTQAPAASQSAMSLQAEFVPEPSMLALFMPLLLRRLRMSSI